MILPDEIVNAINSWKHTKIPPFPTGNINFLISSDMRNDYIKAALLEYGSLAYRNLRSNTLKQIAYDLCMVKDIHLSPNQYGDIWLWCILEDKPDMAYDLAKKYPYLIVSRIDPYITFNETNINYIIDNIQFLDPDIELRNPVLKKAFIKYYSNLSIDYGYFDHSLDDSDYAELINFPTSNLDEQDVIILNPIQLSKFCVSTGSKFTTQTLFILNKVLSVDRLNTVNQPSPLAST